jgi:hypothetical protein
VLNPHLNRVAFDPHVVGLDGLERWQLHRRPCAHVEARAMPRALDLIAFELTLVERAAVVCAQVVDGEELAAHIAHGYLMVADLKYGNAFGRKV